MGHLSRGELAQFLLRPFTAASALTIPLRPGRKHLLPRAQWSLITTEDAALPWARGDAGRLSVMLRLRQAGFGSRMLTAPVPPYTVLRRLPPADRDTVLADWDTLRIWRDRRPWLRLAVHLTTPAAAPAAGGYQPERCSGPAGRGASGTAACGHRSGLTADTGQAGAATGQR